MGNFIFDISKYAKNRGVGAGQTFGALVTSGAHTTSTSATDLTDGAAGGGSAITAVKGDILSGRGDEDMRIAFGGEDATATSGHVFFADAQRDVEVPESGPVSIVDVA